MTIKIISLFVMMVFTTTAGFSNDDKYVAVMQKHIQMLYEAKGVSDLQQAINGLERIASVEKTRWEPNYYIAFGYIMMSHHEIDKGKKDLYLDQAEVSLGKAKAILPGDAELIALEGFVYMMRVSVDPASRGAQLSGAAMQAFQRATAIDPENPRALTLTAQMQYGTAQFFGSPATEACAMAMRAQEKFDTFKSDNVLAPQWGRGMAADLTEKCK
ncbi:MAG TPA: hypothetical protein VD816_19415 [Ohtaekwangia sp.]|nr:hypothetical protein [Ohtaekwangia sp.]